MWRIEICQTIDADKNILKKHLPTYLPYYFQPMLPQLHQIFFFWPNAIEYPQKSHLKCIYVLSDLQNFVVSYYK